MGSSPTEGTMINSTNRFYKGICSNSGNESSNFDHFYILTVRDINDYSGGHIVETVKNTEDYFDDDGMIGSPYYIIYGHFKSNFSTTSLYIMETEFLYQAINIVETLTGNDIKENY